MTTIRAYRSRSAKILLVVSVCVLFLGAIPAAQAQSLGGPVKGDRDDDKPRIKRPPPRNTDMPGNQKGRIIKFKPAKDKEEDEDLLGTLTVKAFERGSKVIRIDVRRSESLRIQVGDHVFDLEEQLDIFWKGLHCTAGWDIADPAAKRKTKELRSLAFDTIEVKGKIHEMEDGLIVIKGVPKDGRNWPDLEAKDRDSQGHAFNNQKKKKRIPRRTMKLKVVEDVTKFVDAEKIEVDVEEFEPDDEVEATVVYGRPAGMMIALRKPVAETNDGDGAERRGGRPAPPKLGGG